MPKLPVVPIEKSTFDFLRQLSKNNNRDWFAKHKPKYLAAHENMIAFAEVVLQRMKAHDLIETPSGKASLFRIYRDIRFSKEKTPYQTCFHGGFKRATKLRRGYYYFHIAPGNTYMSGGFYGPNAEDLKRIREDIDRNHEDWRKLLKSKPIKETFGTLDGDKVATAPRGYAKDHPAIDLLRHKNFILRHHFSDKEALAPNFADLLDKTFQKIRPFFDYMSEVLTTDLDGRSLYEEED